MDAKRGNVANVRQLLESNSEIDERDECGWFDGRGQFDNGSGTMHVNRLDRCLADAPNRSSGQRDDYTAAAGRFPSESNIVHGRRCDASQLLSFAQQNWIAAQWHARHESVYV